jgi:hypothetical protein
LLCRQNLGPRYIGLEHLQHCAAAAIERRRGKLSRCQWCRRHGRDRGSRPSDQLSDREGWPSYHPRDALRSPRQRWDLNLVPFRPRKIYHIAPIPSGAPSCLPRQRSPAPPAPRPAAPDAPVSPTAKRDGSETPPAPNRHTPAASVVSHAKLYNTV